MNKKEYINRLIDETLTSADHIDRAVPQPYLLTRIHARLKRTRANVWEKAGRLIGRPSIAISGLVVLVLLNVVAVVINNPGSISNKTEQAAQGSADELSYTVATIYDFENTEP